MGDRREIIFRFGNVDIYLYSHWCGSELPKFLSLALQLSQKDRWNDPSYLMPDLFDSIYASCSRHSVGLSPYHFNTEWRNLIVDMENRMVYLESIVNQSQFLDDRYTAQKSNDAWTFEEFASLDEHTLSSMSSSDSAWYH